MASLENYYSGISAKMTADLNSISREFGHAGATGRNNEKILLKFLARHLSSEYGLTNGKLVSSDGQESDEADIIIYNKARCPKFMIGEDFQLVPIESCVGIISVKTKIAKSELKDALSGIASARALPRKSAVMFLDSQRDGTPFRQPVRIPAHKVLRPRAFVFAYETGWTSSAKAGEVWTDLLRGVDDDLRPNGLCLLDQAYFARHPYTLRSNCYTEFPLLQMFIHLSHIIDTFPRQSAFLADYAKDFQWS